MRLATELSASVTMQATRSQNVLSTGVFNSNNADFSDFAFKLCTARIYDDVFACFDAFVSAS